MSEIKISEQQKKRNQKDVKELTLLDDILMNAVFDNNLELTGHVLSIILNRKLTVKQAKTQYVVGNFGKRGIRIDVMAVDSKEHLFNIEVQKEEDKGIKPRRARRNGSLLDAACKDWGVYGENLPETYVLFITRTDYWRKGLPIYDFDRKCIIGKEVLPFNDGLHVWYVNGEYRGKDKLGNLMHDFSCANPDDMKSNMMKKHIAPFKTIEGEKKMCKIMEESNKRAAKEAVDNEKERTAMNLLRKNMSVVDISDVVGLSEAEILKIQQKVLVEA